MKITDPDTCPVCGWYGLGEWLYHGEHREGTLASPAEAGEEVECPQCESNLVVQTFNDGMQIYYVCGI